MRYYILICVVFIVCVMAETSPAALQGSQIMNSTSPPVASYSKNPALDYSARKILGYASEARIALDNGRKETAASYVSAAMDELNGIRDAHNYLEMMGLPFGNVLYGKKGSYYIPIADDTYALRNYSNGPFWTSNKTMAVKDVELINVNITINPEKATQYLQKAQQAIAAGKLHRANESLKSLLDDSVHTASVTYEPLARLLDNIYLTRILVRQENYKGARYTLRNAKSALNDYERTITTAEARASIDDLRSEIDMLDTIIQENNPTLLQSAAQKVDQWWIKLKAWTQEKTSKG